jgi:single-strand DNA-binding protein
MAQDLNQCNFIGRLGRDIELRHLPDGKEVASGSMAVNGYKDSVEWVRFTAFGKLAGIMAQYLKKGSKLFLSGRMQTRQWEKDGITRYATEIVANEVQFLGGDPKQTEHPEPPTVDDDSSIPF